MVRFSIIGFLVVFLSLPVLSQSALEGVLLDRKTKAPIPFAAIGIMKLSTGTITNADGTFRLELKDEYDNELLTFSAIGYHKLLIPVNKLKSDSPTVFYLDEEIKQLDEVVIEAKGKRGRSGVRQMEKGNNFFNTGTIRMDAENNGGAIALLINSDKSPFWISEARLRIRYNSLPTFKVRMRLMTVDSITQLPGDDIVKENIFTTSDMKRGWLNFNLKGYNTRIVENDFFLVFEWVLDKESRLELNRQVREHVANTPESIKEHTIAVGEGEIEEKTISDFKSGVWFGTLIDPNLGSGHTCYYRLNSFGKWMPSAAVLSAVATISYFNR